MGNQDGTSDPVLITSFKNTTGGNVTLERVETGIYILVFSSQIVKNGKFFGIITSGTPDRYFSLEYKDTQRLQIVCLKTDGNRADTFTAMIDIELYPTD